MISAEIVKVEEDPSNGNIITWIAFAKDGRDLVTSNVTKNGRIVWALLSGAHNFKAKSRKEKDDWIRINVEHQIGNLIMANTKALVNAPVIAELNKMVGTVYQKDTVDVLIDINGTGETRTLTIKDDGTTRVN